MLKLWFTVCFLVLSVYGEEKVQVFTWSSCSGSSPAASLSSLSVSPSPITYPGDASIDAAGTINRQINGAVRVELTMKRIVLGLGLTIQCLQVDGMSIGSCTYEDACVDILQGLGGLDSTNCPADIAAISNNCECPLDLSEGSFDESFALSVPDLSTSAFSMFSDGDYDVRAKLSDANGEVSCIQTKFSLKKATYTV